MSRSLTISDELYSRLENEANSRGVSIERVIEDWQRLNLAGRKQVVQQIGDLRERLYSMHGEMPGSVDLVREDRAR